jgi:CheY-like chemotaxis protein
MEARDTLADGTMAPHDRLLAQLRHWRSLAMLNPLADTLRFAPDSLEATTSIRRATRPSDAQSRMTPSAMFAQVTQNGLLLLAGDGLTLSESLALRLHQSGFRVMRVSHVDEALKLLVGQTPALLVMEAALSEGTTFVQTLRRQKNAARVPVILVTALTEEDQMEALCAADPNVLIIERMDHTHLERSIVAIVFAGDTMKLWLQIATGPDVPSRRPRFEAKGSVMSRAPPEVHFP